VANGIDFHHIGGRCEAKKAQGARTEQVEHSNRSTVITAPDPGHVETTG
jgi:hypothetical protein